MEFLGLHIVGSLVLILFGFGVGRKWESLNSPSDIVSAYNLVKDKVLSEIAALEKTVEDATAKVEALKKLVP